MNMKTSADLGRRINEARRRADMTVGELARQLTVSRTVASDIVSGKRSPTPSIAQRLIELLDFERETEEDLRQMSEATYTSSALDSTMRVVRYEKPDD